MNIRKSSSLKTSLNIFKPWIATFHGAFAWNCAPLVANQLGHRPLVEAPVPSWKIQELRRWINQKPFGQSSPFRIWINSYHEYPWILRPIYKSCTNELGQCKQKRSKACLAQPFLWKCWRQVPTNKKFSRPRPLSSLLLNMTNPNWEEPWTNKHSQRLPAWRLCSSIVEFWNRVFEFLAVTALFDSFCYFLLRPWHGTTRFKFPLFPHLPRRALWRLLAGAVTNGSVGDYGDCDRDLLLLWRGRFQPWPAEPLTTPRISLKLIEYDRISRFRNLSLWLL